MIADKKSVKSKEMREQKHNKGYMIYAYSDMQDLDLKRGHGPRLCTSKSAIPYRYSDPYKTDAFIPRLTVFIIRVFRKDSPPICMQIDLGVWNVIVIFSKIVST